MDTKGPPRHPAETGLLYQPEDLEQRRAQTEQADADAFLERNSEAIRASIEQSRAEFERGEVFTLDQVMADIDAQRQQRRRAHKP